MDAVRVLADRISTEAVSVMHLKNRIADDSSDAGRAIDFGLIGLLEGLRWALCAAKGWDPAHESKPGKKADSFLRVWHNLPGHCTQEGCGAW